MKFSSKENVEKTDQRQLVRGDNLHNLSIKNFTYYFLQVYGPFITVKNTYIFDQLVESFLRRREDICILGSEVRCECSHHRGYQGSGLIS